MSGGGKSDKADREDTAGTELDLARVEHVAKLASLTLAPGEAATLARELSAIVAYVAQLDTLDTSGVEPTAGATPGTSLAVDPLRADVLVPSLPRDEVLSQAPRAEDSGFAVPVFVE